MKIVQVMAACTLLLAGISSCTKEYEEAVYSPVPAMYESYTGRQGEGVEEPGSFLQLKLDDNGSLFACNNKGELIAAGSWAMSGEEFKGEFRQKGMNMSMHLHGHYEPSLHKISGSWGYGETAIGGGSFYVVKDNYTIAAAKKKNRQPVAALIDRLF